MINFNSFKFCDYLGFDLQLSIFVLTLFTICRKIKPVNESMWLQQIFYLTKVFITKSELYTSLNFYTAETNCHDGVINWKHFPRYSPFVREIHRSPVNSPHKGQWHGCLMFSLICARINSWVNNGEAGDLRRHRTHYDATVMTFCGIKELRTHKSNWFGRANILLCTLINSKYISFYVILSLVHYDYYSTALITKGY